MQIKLVVIVVVKSKLSTWKLSINKISLSRFHDKRYILVYFKRWYKIICLWTLENKKIYSIDNKFHKWISVLPRNSQLWSFDWLKKSHTTITWLENNNNLMTHFLGKPLNALNTSSRFSENVTLCSLAYEQESPIWASEASLATTRETYEACFARPNRRACSQVIC